VKNIIRVISLISVVSLLSACGDSGSSVPAEAPSASLNGTVTDAVITNGTLRVLKFDDGKQGDLIAETITDGKGDFEIADFASQDRPVVIEVSGGRYTEEASGVSVDLLDGQVLRAYMFYEQGSAITLQVTPFTHMASCLADYKIGTGVNVNNAITEATSVFSGLAGVDILGTKPLDITDPNNANFEVTDNLRYGAVLAAISSFTAEASETNGVTPHRFNQNSSIYATQVLCQDIAADGVFNGSGFINNGNSVGQLSLGSVPLDVDTLRSKVAQHILSIISSDRNQTSLGVDDFVLYANEIASSTDGVFGGVPATAVDQVGPTVTAILAPDSFLKGIVNLDFVVTDPIGVKSVKFKVNDVFHSTGQIDNPVMSLNSTSYTDGVISINVVATDILNNESMLTFNYVVDNTSPVIALTSSQLVNNKFYTATGTFEEEGAPVTEILVNGVSAAIDTDLLTWTADITLLSGENVVVLDITDSAENTNSVEIQVDVDLITPTIVANSTLTKYTTFEGQLNLCTPGFFDDESAANNPVCISTDNVSLSGAAISVGLQNDGFLLISFQAEDPEGAGVSSSNSDLIVEYSYSFNGVEKISWTAVPPPAGGTTYYLPVVTEYMGSDWYQVGYDFDHTVNIRVSDSAGNSVIKIWTFKTDVLIPELAFQQSIDDAVLVSTPFASRASLDGTSIDVTYDFSNSSSNPILISLEDKQLHSAKHTYETGVRQNQARVKVSETWKARNCGTKSHWSKPGCPSGTEFSVSNIKHTNGVNSNKSLAPSSAKYSSYQSVTSDIVSVASLSGIPSITKLLGYSCSGGSAPGNDLWYTGAYANNNTGFTVCRYFDDEDGFATKHTSSLKSTISKIVQYKSGFPKNVVSSTAIDINVNTESMSVYNATLGQFVLPVSGWYSIPPETDVTITKKTRLPVLIHYSDTELADLGSFSSYSTKKLDKSTTYNIDTDLTINRVIDTGDIADVDNSTISVSLVGSGIYTNTISR